MLSFLPAPIIGVIGLVLYTLNLFCWAWILYAIALLRLIPIKALQRGCDNLLHTLPYYWQDCNDAIQKLTTKTQYDIRGLEQLQLNEWYLMLSNHQSWADILVLEKVFKREVPILKFFMKKQLLWSLPFAGWACWLLDFPFMERYSKEKIAKHPELKGKDLETTKRSCEKFKLIPTTVITFPEGTRFTAAKHQRQDAPYQYLLRPRAGGVAFTLAAMEGCLHKIIDVTIMYPPNQASMWAFLCGKPRKIIVNVKVLPITADLIGDYENNRDFRVRFQNWLNQLWLDKDQLMTHLKQH
jgi:1-acyl-sn-glycerol-3-phosphate acyltransferase